MSSIPFADLGVVRQVHQLQTDAESLVLYALARGWPGEGRVVELGSWKGGSTVFLAAGVRDRGDTTPVLAVDTFRGSVIHQPGKSHFYPDTLEKETGRINTLPHFLRAIEETGLEDYVEKCIAKTTEAALTFTGAVRLLFIDAEHTYESAKEDFESWEVYLLPGSCVVFHDVGWCDGPTNFCADLDKDEDSEYDKVGLLGRLGIYRKTL